MPPESEMMASRLDAIKEANKRVKVSFFLVIAAATIILSAVWNSSASWSNFAPRHSQLDSKNWDKEIDNDVEKERRKLLLNDSYLTVPLLGIRVAVTDLPLIGSITLLVLCFYYCSCARLANQEISTVLSQCGAEELGVRQFIYFTIRSSMVLNNPTLNDTPVTRLNVPESLPVVRSSIPKAFKAALTYLPLATIIVAVVTDIIGTLLPDYRVLHARPSTWMVVGIPGRIQFILTDSVATLIGVGVWFFSRVAVRYNDASVILMTQFRADFWQ